MNRWLGWLLLLVLALGSTWLLRSVDHDREPTPELEQSQIDYTLADFTAQRLDANGQLLHRLEAAQMVHYKAGHSELLAPLVTFYEAEQAQWQVQSERGEVSAGGDIIWLLGETYIKQLAPSQPPALEIFSHDVKVEQAQGLAETAAPSRIVHAGGETHTVGMRVWMDSQQVELLSQVRGHYEAQP
jgi:lipopolysaccharide export system protein LptC